MTSPTCTRRTMLLRTAQAAAAVAAVPHLGYDAAVAGAENDDRAIWDGHIHLPGVSGSVESRVDQLLTMASRMGIERLVVSMGTSFSQDPSPGELRKENDEVLRAIAHAPDRILGMVYLNPKHEKASLDELDRCVRDGPMIGIKLWIAMRCDRPELDPIVRRAVALKVPIFQHVYERAGGNLRRLLGPVLAQKGAKR